MLIEDGDACRCCRSTDGSTFVCFDDDIVNMFAYCTNIPVNPFNERPEYICRKCSDLLKVCYDFINMCRSADDMLRSSRDDTSNVCLKEELDIILDEAQAMAIKAEQEDHVYEDDHHVYEDDHVYKDDDDDEDEDSKSLLQRHEEWKALNAAALKTEPIKSEAPPIDPFRCPTCNKRFGKKRTLRGHIVYCDPALAEKKFACEKCPRRFKKISELKRHAKTHIEKVFRQCDQCPKRFRLWHMYRKHMKKYHPVETTCECGDCGRRFSNKYSLKAHISYHLGTNHKYLCSVCAKKFSQKANLDRHMLVHTGEKPYKCSVCSFRSAHPSYMKKHERIHSNIRPYTCPECGKTFAIQGVLARHMRIHTGELPYECYYCPCAFIDNWKRKLHLMQVHKMALKDIPSLTPGRKRGHKKPESVGEQNTNPESVPSSLPQMNSMDDTLYVNF